MADQNENKLIEMSRYIDIDLYHQFEQEHPFYREMAENMIFAFRRQRKADHSPCRVLELGAGTGIFTEMLMKEPNIEVTAVEIDSRCYSKLTSTIGQCLHVVCLNTDSLTLRNIDNDHPFDFAFSCFADHHISDTNKIGYLRNVASLLAEDGCFIVGEELLPSYSKHDVHDRDRAIRLYHEHIIELMSAIEDTDCRETLRMLEYDAMTSGLQRVGDFKISRDVYQELLSQAGFLASFTKIGPLSAENVGGVYVVVASRS